MKEVVIVLGAKGFLGNNVVRLLQDRDCEIRVLVKKSNTLKSLDGLKFKYYYGDILDDKSLEEIFEVEDDAKVTVIHLASIVYILNKFNQKVYDVNVLGTKKVADLCLKKNYKLLYVSSVDALTYKDKNIVTEQDRYVIDKKAGLYSQTKAEASNYILDLVNSGLNACILLPSSIIGPYDFGNSSMTFLVSSVASKKLRIGIKGGFDFVDVRDVACGIISCIDREVKGKSYILSNRYFTVKELFDVITDAMKIKKVKMMCPMSLAKFGSLFIQWYYRLKGKTPLFTSKALNTLSIKARLSHSLATSELDYNPRDIKESIVDTISFLKEEGRVK